MRDNERLRLIGKSLRWENVTKIQTRSAGEALLAMADRVAQLEHVLDCAKASVENPAAALMCDEDVALEKAVREFNG